METTVHPLSAIRSMASLTCPAQTNRKSRRFKFHKLGGFLKTASMARMITLSIERSTAGFEG
jgi:hypothetical protein